MHSSRHWRQTNPRSQQFKAIHVCKSRMRMFWCIIVKGRNAFKWKTEVAYFAEEGIHFTCMHICFKRGKNATCIPAIMNCLSKLSRRYQNHSCRAFFMYLCKGSKNVHVRRSTSASFFYMQKILRFWWRVAILDQQSCWCC